VTKEESMPSEVVTAHGAPAPTGPYSPAILTTGTRTLWISGQIADGPDGQIVGGEDPEEQARECLRKLDALLAAAGASRTDVAKVVIFLVDIADRPAVAKARLEYFGDHRPASTLIEVSALALPGLRVEIEAFAVF
jgi:enamine deaminase RidA (YjgF/YER057c/UK114 family)